MTRRTLTTLLGILMLAGAVAPVALADPPPGFPPLQGARFDGRSPDTKDAAYAAHHTNARAYNVAVGYASPPDGTTFDGRSPDTKDAAYAAHAKRATSSSTSGSAGAFDGRSPDTKDAAASAHSTPAPLIITSATGFDSTDAGIGAAAGFGLAALLAAAVGFAKTRHRLPANIAS
jgi:hypothetical protein